MNTNGHQVSGALFAQPAVARRGEQGASQGHTITLQAARALAREGSPALREAREGIGVARGRERQAASRLNPMLSYGREQTTRGSLQNSQDIAAIEQPLDLAGQRGARRAVARLGREAEEARLVALEEQLDFEVVRAFVNAVAADRRAALTQRTAAAFASARAVSEVRLVAGDVSGYAARRLRLEVARYAALSAEASLARENARGLLFGFLRGSGAAEAAAMTAVLDAAVLGSAYAAVTDTGLRTRALAARATVRAAELETAHARAQMHLAERAGVPMPLVSAGFKREAVVSGAGATAGFSGFVAGFTVPLPLFDRQRGNVDAAVAEHRRRAAQLEGVQRQVAREVDEALAAIRTVDDQVALLQPLVAGDAPAAARAAQVAYDEGEITLLDWLDAVRAVHETESALTTLLAERVIRRAALERAVGAHLFPNLGSNP